MLSNDSSPDSDLPPAIGQLIADVIPPIDSGRPEVLNFPAWQQLQGGQSPVAAPLVIETLALLIQRWVNWPVSFAGCELDTELRGEAAIYETRNAEAGLRAGEIAIGLFGALRRESRDRLTAIFRERFDAYRKEPVGVALRSTTAAIARNAQLRGIPWSVGRGRDLIRLGLGQHSILLTGSLSTRQSAIGKSSADFKQLGTAMLAAAGLPVPSQRTARDVEGALAAARWIGYPVVVKPASAAHGDGVTVGVANEKQLGEAFAQARAISSEVVIESVIKGDGHRLLIVGGKFISASWLKPAQVKGDGTSTVRQLVERENLDRMRQTGGQSRRRPLLMDQVSLNCLTSQDLSPEAVPPSDQVVLLRRVSNVSQGGTTEIVTDRVHPSIRELAERAAVSLDIDVCGADFITTDISRPYWETGGAFCEVNANPLLRTRLAGFATPPRNEAAALLGMLYPEGSASRIAVVAILTETGKGELQNAIRAGAIKAGRQIGIASSVSTIIGTQGYPVRSLSHLDGVESIAADKTVDSAIVVVTPHEVVHSGVGLDRIDLAILPSGDRSALVAQACEVLARIADGHVTDDNDPAVLEQALECLISPRGEAAKNPADVSRKSGPDAAPFPFLPGGAPKGGERPDFTLMLLGDIGFGEIFAASPAVAQLRRILAIKGYRFSLARVTDFLKEADLTVGNLAVPLAAMPNPDLRGRKKGLAWSDADETVAALVEAGVDTVSLANNHSLDCGIDGLGDTINKLRESGITAFGAGGNLSDAGQPFVRTVRVGPVERTIVVFGCFEFRENYDTQFNWYARTERPGINPIEPEVIAGQIDRLRKTVPAPFFIAFPHWGIEYNDTQPYQREYAKHLMEAGVDLIIGHGAHTVQGIETVGGRPVVYGIGNFVWNAPDQLQKSGAPPFGLAAALQFRHLENGLSVFLRLYPLMIDNSISDFQNRPVSALEFPVALAALTKNFNGSNQDLVPGMDRLGHYVEIQIEKPAKSV